MLVLMVNVHGGSTQLMEDRVCQPLDPILESEDGCCTNSTCASVHTVVKTPERMKCICP